MSVESLAPPAATRGGERRLGPGFWRRWRESDLWWSFKRSKLTIVAAAVTAAIVLSSFLAPVIAPYDPTDLSTLSLLDAMNPPAWVETGTWAHPLGTDDQGRDMLSAILYGSRISLIVGAASVLLAMAIGVALGLAAGYFGGWLDGAIMRLADVQLSFPAILIAILVDGVAKTALPRDLHGSIAILVVILAIALSKWVDFARTVRGSTLVERGKEYVQAARVIGVHPLAIMFRHVLPNVLGPVLVIATINLAQAILIEATLSFLGLGVPATQPSLGTLIRIGNNFLFSGEWWITIFPGLTLALLALAVNLLGDWLRDALNPRLR
jgi:peptide/nickel transport system permease protein